MPLRPSRYPSRASEDQDMINSVLDAGLFCTIAFNRDGIPHQIPTGYCRIGDKMYIHASSKSHFIDSIAGQQVSFSVTHLDAMVLSVTAFDHSFNYRSVIGFAEGKEITEENEKIKIFKAFTDRYIPGRIADIGDPTSDQIMITKVIELSLNEAAVKVREGDAGVKDLSDFDKWVGVIPVETKYGSPRIDEKLEGKVELPTYLKELKLEVRG